MKIDDESSRSKTEGSQEQVAVLRGVLKGGRRRYTENIAEADDDLIDQVKNNGGLIKLDAIVRCTKQVDMFGGKNVRILDDSSGGAQPPEI